MTKSRIEGLLSAFPKLIGNGKQHTFIETENIRYVYQPLESLYLVLVTNKNSNILEDLETLHLLAKLVPEYSSFEEADVSRRAFDIIFSFDEVIAMGYKERVTVQQIKHFISMESHEEERVRMEQQMREKEAKSSANKKIKEIERLRQESLARGGNGRVGGGIGSGMGGNGSMSGMGGGSGEQTPPTKPAMPGKAGMKLTKSNKKSTFAQVLKEEKVVEKEEELEALLSQDTGSSTPPVVAHVNTEAVHIDIEETFTAQIENDGSVEGIDIKGGLSVTVNDANLGRVRLAIQQGSNVGGFQFITHPNIDKPAFLQSSVLRLKDGVKIFPAGGVLKWRCKTTDDAMIPFKVSCWPSPSGQTTTVNLEYDCITDLVLKNILVAIPNPSGSAPVIGHFDGLYEYDSKQKQILWKIPVVDDSNRQGSIEFTVKGATSAFFPLHVQFISNRTLCDISLGEVVLEESGTPTRFSSQVNLAVDSYEINN
eukprot:gene7781-9130_t